MDPAGGREARDGPILVPGMERPALGMLGCSHGLEAAMESAALPGVDARALRRSREALSCLPFRRALYDALASSALSSSAIASAGTTYSRTFLNANAVESHLIWLIQLGVLRREVDGQGLTERVRLTPMGRELLSSIPGEIPGSSMLIRLRHSLRRHRLRL